MQTSDRVTQSPPQPDSSHRGQPPLQFSAEWTYTAFALLGAGLIVAAVHGFAQFLIQIYLDCWQMAFLFILIGVMTTLLLGQYSLNLTESKSTNDWVITSSIIVTTLGISVIACILVTPLIA